MVGSLNILWLWIVYEKTENRSLDLLLVCKIALSSGGDAHYAHYVLSEMLQTRSSWDLGCFGILEYLLFKQWDILEIGLNTKYEIQLCLQTLYTQSPKIVLHSILVWLHFDRTPSYEVRCGIFHLCYITLHLKVFEFTFWSKDAHLFFFLINRLPSWLSKSEIFLFEHEFI